jgi:hypothetical protein
MKIDGNLNSSDFERIGRVTTELVNEMVNNYFNHSEVVTTLKKQISTFEAKRGIKNRWMQVVIQVNANPLTFIPENEIHPGLIDEKTFVEIVDEIYLLTTTTLDKMESAKVNPYIAESFVQKIEKLTELIRNKLLTINY